MSKRFIIIVLSILVLIFGGYLYLRYSLLKSTDFKPDTSGTNALDLRPALIAKLKQLVKDGSDGLYILSLAEIDPSLIESTLFLRGVKIEADPKALAYLDSLKKAPDEVFTLIIDSIKVDGLGIGDLLSKKNIDLASVRLYQPNIEFFNSKRIYNKTEPDTLTLYQKIRNELGSLSVKEILMNNAMVTSHDMQANNAPVVFNKINVSMKDLLIDSSTMNDKSRFLFAKEADISLDKYSIRTSDSLYFLNSGEINISATKRMLTAKHIEFVPRHNKAQFQVATGIRKDRMHIKMPRVVLSGIDWWRFANYESLIATQADIYDCSFSDYIDKSSPPKKFKADNYPHQAIMNIPLKISIDKVNLHNMDLEYEEFNPESDQQGTLYFSKINGSINNITNISSSVSRNRYTTLKADAMFMKLFPTKIEFKFDLAKVKTGEFEVKVRSGGMDPETLNKLAEPLAMFHLKTGNVKELNATIKGNNKSANADFLLTYDDLYIIPLKKDDDKASGIDKQRLMGFLANLIKIKKSNPSGSSAPRTFQYNVARKAYPGFFTHVWKTLLSGIIKTIGAPAKLAQ